VCRYITGSKNGFLLLKWSLEFGDYARPPGLVAKEITAGVGAYKTAKDRVLSNRSSRGCIFFRHNRSSDVFNKLLQNRSLGMVEKSPCKKRPLCRECEFPAVETPPKNCKPGASVTLQTSLRSVIPGREVTADRAFQVKCYHVPFAFQLKETTRHHKAPDSATFRSKRS
jgi:hypothetical protein